MGFCGKGDGLAVIAGGGGEDSRDVGLLARQFIQVDKASPNLEGADGGVVFVFEPQFTSESRLEQWPPIGGGLTDQGSDECLRRFDLAEGWQGLHLRRVGQKSQRASGLPMLALALNRLGIVSKRLLVRMSGVSLWAEYI